MTTWQDLTGKVALVSGGAGGIGGALAGALARGGAAVTTIDLERSDALQPEIQQETCDLRSEAAVAEVMEAVRSRHQRLDVLVAAAGIQLHNEDGPVAEVSEAAWQRTIDVNLTGTFRVLKAATPLLLESPASSVILIGSPTGLTMSGAGYAAYAASKAGMMALARVMAADYAGAGMRANVVIPGTTRTQLIAELLADEATRGQLMAGIPLHRLGEPDDLAGIVTWLASDSSAYATGGFFPVDGGLTAR